MLYRQIQTGAEGENVAYYLKTSSSYKLTGEKSLAINEAYAEKIKVKVFVNQQNSVS